MHPLYKKKQLNIDIKHFQIFIKPAFVVKNKYDSYVYMISNNYCD